MIAASSHPNIVQALDVGEADFDGEAVPYVAMEYLPDGDLMSLIERRKRLPERQAARIGADVATALAHAHERAMVHEDIKPQNILMEFRRAKLTDFNFVQGLQPRGFSGAARYLAPECLQGEALPASDVYSLGVTLYQTVVGGTPFRGTRRTVIQKHVTEKAVPPRERSSISQELENVILCCLHKNPSERPTAIELERKLRGISRRAIFRAPLRSARLWIGERLAS